MTSKMAGLLVAHGVALIVLTFVFKRLTPDLNQTLWLAGLVGGGLCVLWGVLGFMGFRRRIGAVLTLIPLSLIILGGVVDGWMGRSADDGIVGPVIATVMLLGSIVVLAYILHAGEQTAVTVIVDSLGDRDARPLNTKHELRAELRHRR
jgi:lipid-A-disaccharide synthase-like uncharacterized protein